MRARQAFQDRSSARAKLYCELILGKDDRAIPYERENTSGLTGSAFDEIERTYSFHKSLDQSEMIVLDKQKQ